jgi:hypothetical protein
MLAIALCVKAVHGLHAEGYREHRRPTPAVEGFTVATGAGIGVNRGFRRVRRALHMRQSNRRGR